MTGSWEVNVSIGSMPEKVATAFAELDSMVGCEYSPIAYLGSQVVNGINYAVLAEQTVLAGKDSKNVVLTIFNEKGNECHLTDIERVLESGDPAGGVIVSVETGDSINPQAMDVFNQALSGYVGVKIELIAYLGSQVVRGVDYIYACEVTPTVVGGKAKVCIVRINDLDYSIQFADLLRSSVENEAIATATATVRIQSPWVLFYKEVYALFARDPQVNVMFDNDTPELKIQVKGNDTKAACLSRFFPKEKAFGNVILKCSVVGDDGQTVPDVNCDDHTAIRAIFEGNDALSFIKDVQTPFDYSIVYVVFVKEVVQYYSDNMYDLYGATSTIYENLARDIFGMPFDNGDYCSFCTDAEISIGCPLGEWP